MSQSRFESDQNRQLGQLLMEMNYDLRMREKPVIHVSWLQMFGYASIGAVVFLIFTGVLRVWWRF